MSIAKLCRPEDRQRDENQSKALRAQHLASYLAAQAEIGPLKEAANLLLEYAHILSRIGKD